MTADSLVLIGILLIFLTHAWDHADRQERMIELLEGILDALEDDEWGEDPDGDGEPIVEIEDAPDSALKFRTTEKREAA